MAELKRVVVYLRPDDHAMARWLAKRYTSNSVSALVRLLVKDRYQAHEEYSDGDAS